MDESLLSIDTFAPFVEGLDHPETVTWGPDGFLYAGGEAGQIYRIDLEGTYEQIASTDGFILGLCLDAARNVYACDQGKHAIMRITPAGAVSTYATGSQERPLRTPNYPVFDRQGNLYVSDSGGWHEHNGCLFRIRPTGQVDVVSEELRQFPNGLALSPDESELYVVLSNASSVVKVALHSDGRVGAPRAVVELPRTVPDGLAFDAQGNLYIACYTPDVIYRLSPTGRLGILADDWESVTFATPTNVAFCGDGLSTLAVSSLSRWHLTKGPVPIPGHALQYPALPLP